MAGYFQKNESSMTLDEERTLKRAALRSLLKSYFEKGFELGKFSSLAAAMAELKKVCNDALNNGDVDESVYTDIANWMKSSPYSMEAFGASKRQERSVFAKTCLTQSLEGDLGDALRGLKEAEAAYQEKLDACIEAYAPTIDGFAAEFLRLYGRLLDADIRKTLNV